MVQLINYPVRRGLRQQQYYDELLRELNLMMISSHQSRSYELHAPQKLLDVIDAMVNTYVDVINSAAEQRAAAYARGDRAMTLVYPMVPGTKEFVTAFADSMDSVDHFCRSGNLLTLATPPELLELRRWSVSEFLRQAEGQEPRPWTGLLD